MFPVWFYFVKDELCKHLDLVYTIYSTAIEHEFQRKT